MLLLLSFFFFFNDTATTEIYTLSLHDALPICDQTRGQMHSACRPGPWRAGASRARSAGGLRSEEHTSELQSRLHLVCRLLLEKKKNHEIQTQDYKPDSPINPTDHGQDVSRIPL